MRRPTLTAALACLAAACDAPSRATASVSQRPPASPVTYVQLHTVDETIHATLKAKTHESIQETSALILGLVDFPAPTQVITDFCQGASNAHFQVGFQHHVVVVCFQLAADLCRAAHKVAALDTIFVWSDGAGEQPAADPHCQRPPYRALVHAALQIVFAHEVGHGYLLVSGHSRDPEAETHADGIAMVLIGALSAHTLLRATRVLRHLDGRTSRFDDHLPIAMRADRINCYARALLRPQDAGAECHVWAWRTHAWTVETLGPAVREPIRGPSRPGERGLVVWGAPLSNPIAASATRSVRPPIIRP